MIFFTLLFTYFSYHNSLCLRVYDMCIEGHICVEVRVQRERMSSFLPLCRSPGLNSGLQGFGSKPLYLLSHLTTPSLPFKASQLRAYHVLGLKRISHAAPRQKQINAQLKWHHLRGMHRGGPQAVWELQGVQWGWPGKEQKVLPSCGKLRGIRIPKAGC